MPPAEPTNPADLLMNLIVALLAPMFLGVTNGDLTLARQAAAETIAAYRAQNHADLIAIAQIIAYGLAALGSLSLSMADDLSLSMTLRLRGNANACTRSAEQNRRALTLSFAETPMPYRPTQAPTQAPTQTQAPKPDPQTTVDAFLSRHAEKILAAEARARLHQPDPTPQRQQRSPTAAAPTQTISDKRTREMWAIVRAKEAADVTASIPHLPPNQRPAASIRAAALSSTAHDLLTNNPTATQAFKL